MKSTRYTGGDFMFCTGSYAAVKYGICYIKTKNGPIATKRKAYLLIEL